MNDRNQALYNRGVRQSGGEVDLVVVGAGSAGFSASITAAELGARVALVGHGTIGGTCVNVGCVPSKTMIRATETLHQAATASRFAGIHAKGSIDSWQAMRAQKDELVSEMRQSKYIDLLPSYSNITYLEGAARLTDSGVAINGTLIKVDKVVVTTGATPAVPSIAGIKSVPYLTSTTALELERLPASMLVVGGGYIGCELAQMFARAGVDVTIVCRSRLLPETEPEISDALIGYFRDEGITVHKGIAYKDVRQTDQGVALDLECNGSTKTIHAEKVVIASGRRSNIDGLGLQDVEVKLTATGGIQANEYLQTTNPCIYAAGDVTDRDQFVYMAAYGAKLAAENALNGNSRKYDTTAMPAVTFTDPQVAGVGLTEAAAQEQGLKVKTAVLPLSYLPRALAARDTRGLFKLVANRESDQLLGAHILAPEGADSIQAAALAIKQRLTTKELADMIFPYLTNVEGLKLAAQTFEKDVTKLSCCAG